MGQNPCDTTVWITDSICEGDSYNFNGRQLTADGYYYDTLPRVEEGCDSAIILHLHVLEELFVGFTALPVCHDGSGYRLYGNDYAPYVRWSSQPHDSTLAGQEYNFFLHIDPSQPTTYTQYVDYRAAPPMCPKSRSITLNPMQTVQAHFQHSPPLLSLNAMDLTLQDLSTGNRTDPYSDHHGRVWYIDNQLLTETAERVTFTTRPPKGSMLQVKIVAYNSQCIDSVTHNIPYSHATLSFPNIFIPSPPEEGTFRPIVSGLSHYELWIFNRYGQLLFHTLNPSDGWDGSFQGVPCPQGTYTYRCRYSDILTPSAILSHSGTVTLIR